MNIVELFEPKLPPINLLCLPPASWFYRNTPDRPRVSKAAIRRSVASSTAIETGKSVTEIERLLEQRNGRFRDLKLAD